ncbi:MULTISPECIES: TrmB family transcriptional regulator [unclassified Brevundimonas]|uniref:TrmB family transcriptional regulator n=1 Tax=unclassified Brevundimonas TaxID=2622653 RepID=UPI0025B8B459|nr:MULTISPECIES: helix-turn-helix domain-containing protein [unclassified Brevundimonas]
MTPEETLMPLGFTETEALTYCELLRAGPSTGYRIAQGIGKAQANTYKTLSTLAQKGAVIDDGGEPRLFRAISPDQLIKSLEQRLSVQAETARSALSNLEPHVAEDRLYQIRSVDNVWAHCAQMIANAREVIVFDIFPELEDRIMPLLSKAAARGVSVQGVVYVDRERDPAIETVRSRAADGILCRWPGVEMRLVVDANQHLMALLSRDMDSVMHGLWSESVYLSVSQHYALSGEIRLHRIDQETNCSPHLTIKGAHPPGLRALLASTPDPTV